MDGWTKMTHYEIFGYTNDPTSNDLEADYKSQCKTKKELYWFLKIVIDEMDLESIQIFKVNDGGKVLTDEQVEQKAENELTQQIEEHYKEVQ